jgi:TPR repeat protein
MGISFAPGAAASDLQELARRAQAGDKQAQLDLGIAYEEGCGVAVDLKRAEGLYRMAAADSGGTRWVYAPATQKGAAGRVIPVGIGAQRFGVVEAQKRLSNLQADRK